MKKGFTLAEVLITMGVIGVISVLTIPNLYKDYQKKVYVAQLQKTYNQISNGLAQLMSDEGVDNLAESSLKNSSYDFLMKYFKGAKSVNAWNALAGWYTGVNNSGGGSYTSVFGTTWFNCAALPSGATVCMTTISYSNDGKIIVDVNGKKYPNMNGRDFWGFYYNAYGDLRSYPSAGQSYSNTSCTGMGTGCLDYAIQNGWQLYQ